MGSWVVGSAFCGGSEVSRTGQRARGEPVFSRSARRASEGERGEDDQGLVGFTIQFLIYYQRIYFYIHECF